MSQHHANEVAQLVAAAERARAVGDENVAKSATRRAAHLYLEDGPQGRARYEPSFATRSLASARGGFSLMEVMVALAILLIGLVAIASIFPVATLLQKQTIDDIEIRQHRDNVEAIIAAYRLTDSPPDSPTGAYLADTSADLYNLPYHDGRIHWIPGKWANSDLGYGDGTEYPPGQARLYAIIGVIDQSRSDRLPFWIVSGVIVRRPTTPMPDGSPAPIPTMRTLAVTANHAGGMVQLAFDNSASIVDTGSYVVTDRGDALRVREASASGVTVAPPFPEGPATVWVGDDGGHKDRGNPAVGALTPRTGIVDRRTIKP